MKLNSIFNFGAFLERQSEKPYLRRPAICSWLERMELCAQFDQEYDEYHDDEIGGNALNGVAHVLASSLGCAVYGLVTPFQQATRYVLLGAGRACQAIGPNP